MKTQATMQILGALIYLSFGASDVSAHGEGTISSPSTSVVAGTSLTLSGAGFVPGEAHRLLLRGALEEYELSDVTASPDSTFAEDLMIMADVRPGQYRIVAVAPDGAEVATLDMPVLAALTEAGGTQVEATSDSARISEARAEEMVIERSRAGFEWAVIGLLIGLTGGLGIGVLGRGFVRSKPGGAPRL